MQTTILPASMLTIQAPTPGDAEALKFISTPIPEIAEHEVLIKVAAAGVNRPDILQRQGFYPPPKGVTSVLGLEVAGTIVKIGSAVEDWQLGDRVFALLAGGGYSEYAAAAAEHCLKIPNNIDFQQAAALAETFFTVWYNVFQLAQAKAGQSILIHGGNSGIGTSAIQLCNAFGLTTIVTASSDEKCEACLQIGAHKAINYKKSNFVDECKSFTEDKGVDIILDMLGGEYTSLNYAAAAVDATIVQIAYLAGAKVTVPLHMLLHKRLKHQGSTLRNQSVEVKAKIAAQLQEKLLPLLENGRIKPIIYKSFAFKDVKLAHLTLEQRQHFGKIILEL